MGPSSLLLSPTRSLWWYAAVLSVIATGGFVVWASMSETVFMKKSDTPLYRASIQETPLLLELARTPQEREQGLSGRQELPDGQGMLFVYPSDDRYGFWMPNMRFSIDIIWFDTDMKVVYIAEHVTPESYPTVFTPDTPARYVLEVPAGWVKEHDIVKGDTLVLDT